MSERLRRISIIGVCLSALLAVVILPLQAGANSKPVAKTAAAKTPAAKTAAQKAKALKAKRAKAKKAKAAAARRAKARKRLAAEKAAAAKKAAAAAAAAKRAAAVVTTTQPPVVTTTTPTTLAPVVPPVVPPVPVPTPCVGRAMTNGQADINAAPAGTTFCLSGTHNWSLTPKSGDQLIGPAVLDGGNSTQYAIRAGTSAQRRPVGARDPQLHQRRTDARRHRRPRPGQGDRFGLAVDQPVGARQRDEQRRRGRNVGNGWQVLGGRYYNNRQEGIGGAWHQRRRQRRRDRPQQLHQRLVHDPATELRLTRPAASSGSPTNVTVTNSTIHDNACKGIWTDGGNATTP